MSVSVVIPCYNHAHFLAESIRSAVTQEGPACEVIVIDDGSTDDTPRVAAAFPVRYIRQRNAGLSAARNTGLRAGAGQYVVFLDADDRLLPGALAAGIAALVNAPEAAFAYGGHVNIDEWGRPLPPSPSLPLGTDAYATLLRGNCIVNPAAAMYRRWIFDRVGVFDTRLTAAEDYDLYLRIARRFSIVAHPTMVVQYRRHRAAMSADPARMLRNTLRVARAQRPWVATPARRAAWHAGILSWEDYYGRPLAWRVGSRLAKGQWYAAATDAATVVGHTPGLIVHVMLTRARRRMLRRAAVAA
jgi:glycosyltransferase involved in cell wall biosynthesis